MKCTFHRNFKQLLINSVYSNGFKKLVVPRKENLQNNSELNAWRTLIILTPSPNNLKLNERLNIKWGICLCFRTRKKVFLTRAFRWASVFKQAMRQPLSGAVLVCKLHLNSYYKIWITGFELQVQLLVALFFLKNKLLENTGFNKANTSSYWQDQWPKTLDTYYKYLWKESARKHHFLLF